jgi:hypothetical protein
MVMYWGQFNKTLFRVIDALSKQAAVFIMIDIYIIAHYKELAYLMVFISGHLLHYPDSM